MKKRKEKKPDRSEREIEKFIILPGNFNTPMNVNKWNKYTENKQRY